MTDVGRELASLVADVSAILTDATQRGALTMPEGEPHIEDFAADSTEPGESLAAIRADLGDCKRCGLCAERRNIVFGVGSPNTSLAVIGEAPGYHEDRIGEPFVGPAGEMLDNMLARVVGIPRPEAYILNIVKCRPPKNRNPLPDEVGACLPFLERQIDALRPDAILLLGSVALKSLFNTPQGIMRHRGRWMSYRNIPVMPTFHPAYLLRNPADKRKTFEDLKALRKRLEDGDSR